MKMLIQNINDQEVMKEVTVKRAFGTYRSFIKEAIQTLAEGSVLVIDDQDIWALPDGGERFFEAINTTFCFSTCDESYEMDSLPAISDEDMLRLQ